MLLELAQYLIPIIVGAVTVPLYDAFQSALGFLQRIPKTVTRIVVGVLAFFLGKLVLYGVALSGTDVTALGQGDIANLIAAGLAYLFHLANSEKDAH